MKQWAVARNLACRGGLRSRRYGNLSSSSSLEPPHKRSLLISQFIPIKCYHTSRITSRMLSTKIQSDGSDNSTGSGGGRFSPGSLLIGFGWTMLGLVAVEQYLQYQQQQEREEFFGNLQKEANYDKKKPLMWGDTDEKTAKDLPSLFSCKILRTESSLDGTLILKGIQVGDVVEVLEEDVGPSNAYHLCRFWHGGNDKAKDTSSIGWYPIQYLQETP